MKIVEINDGNVKKLARFMADIKPEWWTVDGALEQLTDITGVIGTKGWMIGEGEDRPKGWLLCREYIAYSCLEIECGGYDDNGTFALEHKLPELMEEAEPVCTAKGNPHDENRAQFTGVYLPWAPVGTVLGRTA